MKTTSVHVMRVVIAIVTSLALIAAFVLLGIISMPRWLVDSVSGSDATAYHIVQQRLQSYCSARMTLPDSTDWGDSDYRASAGDLSTSARFAAFGSAYTASVTSFDGKDTANQLKSSASVSNRNALTYTDQDGTARLLSATLLKAGVGSGQAGTVASRASNGDLRGISAATCAVPSISHSFLLPASSTGTSQQLVLANPSSKTASVSVQIRGTKSSGAIGLSTSGTVTVPANGEATMNLSAAAGGQDGLYVSVNSSSVSVGAVVRTVVMDGLTPKGSDFAMPTGKAATSNLIPSLAEGDHVFVYLYGEHDAKVSLSWVTEDGLVTIDTHQIKGERVTVLDIGNVPAKAYGVLASSDANLVAGVKAVRSGNDGQEDFSLLSAVSPEESSAAVLPEGVASTLTLANTSNAQTDAQITFIADDGETKSEQKITLKANSAVTVTGEGLAALVNDADRKVAWAVRLTGADLGDGVAGLSAFAPTALVASEETVHSTPDSSLVH